jgi:TPR repeat protein
MWNIFNLSKEANSGSAAAQHELGIRYLTGQGVFVDTVKAAYWVKKAAEQKLVSACYNYGIFLNNGFGVEWNPNEAFKYFMYAAEKDMPDAQYAVGIFYTDNLITERNWNVAYLWVKKAAAAGYKAAKEFLPVLEQKISKDFAKDTAQAVIKFSDLLKTYSQTPNKDTVKGSGLVFLDFNKDSTTEINDSVIWQEYIRWMKIAFPADSTSYADTLEYADMNLFNKIDALAKNGSPEALTLIGRFYERGYYVKKDLITAMLYYLQALRLDSPVSPFLLWKMITKRDVTKQLKQLVDKNDAEAKYIWASLFTIGLDYQITKADALRLLRESAQQNYIPALIELGLCLYNGALTFQDQPNALAAWNTAAKLGSSEAALRIVMSRIILREEDQLNGKELFSTLTELEQKGSVTAQIALSFCYERGLGTDVSKSKAAKYFRLAAQRGSRFAYQELKRLYDEYKRM